MTTAAAVVLISLALLVGGSILAASWRFVGKMRFDEHADEAHPPRR
jgi:hypothetical protein